MPLVGVKPELALPCTRNRPQVWTKQEEEIPAPSRSLPQQGDAAGARKTLVRNVLCRASAGPEGRLSATMAGLGLAFFGFCFFFPCKASWQPWPHLNRRTETLTGAGQPHLSPRTLLRDGCVSWRSKQPSKRSRSIQTSHGSESEVGRGAVCRDTLDHSGFAGPLDSKATSLAEEPFPSAHSPRTAGGGGDYSSPQLCSSRGRESHFSLLSQPSLPPGMDFCFTEASAGSSPSQAGGT